MKRKNNSYGLFKELMENLKYYAGEWHSSQCLFPNEDRAVCNCDLANNARVVKSFFVESPAEGENTCKGCYYVTNPFKCRRGRGRMCGHDCHSKAPKEEDKERCVWCGITYEGHEDDYEGRPKPRTPCLLLKSGFVASNKPHPSSVDLPEIEELHPNLNDKTLNRDAIVGDVIGKSVLKINELVRRFNRLSKDK